MDTDLYDCVCADCGHEQRLRVNLRGIVHRCQKCGSLRIATLSFVVEHFGENWKEDCFGKKENE